MMRAPKNHQQPLPSREANALQNPSESHKGKSQRDERHLRTRNAGMATLSKTSFGFCWICEGNNTRRPRCRAKYLVVPPSSKLKYQCSQSTHYHRQGVYAKKDATESDGDCEEAVCSMNRVLGSDPNKAAKSLVSSLDQRGRTAIIAALLSAPADSGVDDPNLQCLQNEMSITTKETLILTTKAAIGMIGFGFVDNAVMIIAGDAIQNSIGDTFGLSTMTSAGLGNAVSDFLGTILCGYIERTSEKFMPELHLSPLQLQSTRAQWAETVGASTGVTFGCILGLAPVLFISETGGGGSNMIASTSHVGTGSASGRREQSTTFASISNAFRATGLKGPGSHRTYCLPLLLSVSLLLIAKRMRKFLLDRRR